MILPSFDATHAPRHARRVKPTVEQRKQQKRRRERCGSVGFVGAAAAAAASKVPAHRCVSFAAPAHERRLLPRVRARGGDCRASAPAPSLCFPVFRAGRIDRQRRRRASRRAHRNLEATRRPSGQPRARRTSTTQEPWPCRPMAPCRSRRLPRNKSTGAGD